MCFATDVSAASLQPPAVPIPATQFGMHIHRAARTAVWPSVPFGSWRLWDCYVAWPWLEPAKGIWHFDELDKIVALAEKSGVQLMLPLGLSPSWASARPVEKSDYSKGYAAEPANLDDWRIYVKKVATRYKGRIRCFEIWNEPNLTGFYSGSTRQMVTLAREAYRIIKAVDPNNTVVSPSATSGKHGIEWLDGYLAAGGGAFADVIGFHFYVPQDRPEAMIPLIAGVRDVMMKHTQEGKPLWNTEIGWFINDSRSGVKPKSEGFGSNVLTPDVAAAYVARSYILSWAAGVERLYWYSWDAEEMGLSENGGRLLKPAAVAFSNVQPWLTGATLRSCRSDDAGTWSCLLDSRKGGFSAIVWNPDRDMLFVVPPEWGQVRATDLFGSVHELAPGRRIKATQSPLLLEK